MGVGSFILRTRLCAIGSESFGYLMVLILSTITVNTNSSGKFYDPWSVKKGNPLKKTGCSAITWPKGTILSSLYQV